MPHTIPQLFRCSRAQRQPIIHYLRWMFALLICQLFQKTNELQYSTVLVRAAPRKVIEFQMFATLLICSLFLHISTQTINIANAENHFLCHGFCLAQEQQINHTHTQSQTLGMLEPFWVQIGSNSDRHAKHQRPLLQGVLLESKKGIPTAHLSSHI